MALSFLPAAAPPTSSHSRTNLSSEWNREPNTLWPLSDIIMDNIHAGQFRDPSENRTPRENLRLPNFSNFVTAAGHPNLAYRIEGRDQDSQSNTIQQPSLPTPPSTSGQSWPSIRETYRQAHLDPSPQFTEHVDPGRPTGNGSHRRQQSMVMQSDVVPSLKSSRSFSMSDRRSELFDAHSQPHGRVVREEIFPGRGVCYVYEDGTVCPKTMNGDTVNPKWGTTKAGKPRKRLGQACNTCREKKIKCDPSYPKCSQCQKFGRDCRFEAPSRSGGKSPVSRGSMGSPTSSYTAEEDHHGTRTPTKPVETTTHDEKSHVQHSRGSMVVEKVASPSSSDQIEHLDTPTPAKRIRLTHSGLPFTDHNSAMEGRYDYERHQSRHEEFGPETDPLIIDEENNRQLLSMFFNNTTFAPARIFSQQSFTQWAHTERNKKLEDIIVLYTVLALAASLVKTPEALILQPIYTNIVKDQLKQFDSYTSLQTTQTNHLLSLIELSAGNHDSAFRFSSRACASALALGLDKESTWKTHTGFAYNLNPNSFAECKRRTFWAIYTVDCHLSIVAGFPSIINATNVLLPFPSNENLAPQDQAGCPIFFDGEDLGLDWTRARSIDDNDTTSYLVQVITLCKQTRSMIQRIADRLALDRPTADSTQRNWLDKQLKMWEDDCKDRMKKTEQRIQDRRKSSGTANMEEYGRLQGLVMLCFFAQLQANRYFNHAASSSVEITGRVRRSHSYAIKILETAQILVSKGLTDANHLDPTLITPITALGTFAAIDTITAAGTVSDVLENRSRMMQLVYKGLELLGHIAESLPNLSDLHRKAEERIQSVYTSVSAGLMDRKVAFFVSEPMKIEYEQRLDAVYGIDRAQYLEILGWAEGVGDDNDLLKIGGKR